MTTSRLRFHALLLMIFIGIAAQLSLGQDPSVTGPHAVTVTEYSLGDSAFTPPGFSAPVEILAAVFYPADLTNGPYPLIVFLHGRHSVCDGGTFTWPCPAGQSSIKSYRGYDYSGSQLASNGYIVVSISANGINARDNSTSDLGANARASLIQQHLNMWSQFNSPSGGTPFGTLFSGRVNMSRLGTMGHSRGGEGVLRHSQISTFPVKVVVPVAPTDFSRWQVNNGISTNQILSYCDGDVSNIHGLHVYDDARYKMTSGGNQAYITVMGGNHNFYNTVWTPGGGPGASDDWTESVNPWCGTAPGNSRLTAGQQQAVGKAYLAAYFRAGLGESQFFPWVDHSSGLVPSVAGFRLNYAFHGNDSQRLDLNRLQTSSDLTTDFLGGPSSQIGLSSFFICGGSARCTSSSDSKEPHTSPMILSALPTLTQLNLAWAGPGAKWENDIPGGSSQDISHFSFLDFRTSVNFTQNANPAGQAQDLSVRFTDASGVSSSVRVGSVSDALFYPPGGNLSSFVPKIWMNTVRIPLANVSGVDKTRIAKVEFVFDQNSSGALLISEAHFYGQSASTGNPFIYSRPRDQQLACYGISVTPNFPSNCRDISDANDRQMCYGLSQLSQSPCTTITDRNLQLACYGMSVAPNFPSNCRDITDPQMQNFCYGVSSGGSLSNCNNVSDSNTRALCQGFSVHNASLCSGITNTNDRLFCQGVSSRSQTPCTSIQ